MIAAYSRFAPIWAAMVMLVGCGGSQLSMMDASGGAPQGRDATASPAEDTRYPEHGNSWMSPAAKTTKKLLYISDGNDDVYVFDYRTSALLGKLSGYGQFSQGQCVDRRGNVWFTELGFFGSGGAAVEYAHGGRTPLRSLETEGSSIGCSIDPTSGDLAVANVSSGGSAPAEIVVFKNASGTPAAYHNSDCGRPTRPGYDKDGNLYVEGHVSYGRPSVVCEIPHRGKALKPVHIDVNIPIPEGAMWDGKYITLAGIVGFPAKTAIFQMAEDESGNLKKVGRTTLTDTCNGVHAEVEQPFVVGNNNTPANRRQSNAIVGGNMACLSIFDYWSYPAGANPVKTIPSYSSSNQSVSIAPD